MKKKVFGKKLSRDRGSRGALFRSLIKALVEHGKIITTKTKAKAIQPKIDKLANLAKDGSLAARRRVNAYLTNDRVTTNKLFNEIAKSLKDRRSGFTRIVPLPRRRGDMAEMVRLEWSQVIEEPAKSAKDKKIKKIRDKVQPKDKAKTQKSLKDKLGGLKKKSK